jgi:hypothetical protein
MTEKNGMNNGSTLKNINNSSVNTIPQKSRRKSEVKKMKLSNWGKTLIGIFKSSLKHGLNKYRSLTSVDTFKVNQIKRLRSISM